MIKRSLFNIFLPLFKLKFLVSGETVKNSNMVRENGDTPDGADEKMLGSDDKESLALKNIEVKFISGDQNQNGDAKVEIGNVEKVSLLLI